MAWLSVVSTLLSLLSKVYEQLWSDSAILARLKQKQAEVRLSQAAEAGRLAEEYARIESQHLKTHDALITDLNRRFGGTP